MIICKADIQYLPVEQPSRGGPYHLGLISAGSPGAESWKLPDQSQVSLPVWSVPAPSAERGNYLLLWRVRDGLAAVSGGASYGTAASNWSSLDYVLRVSPRYWNRYATGRWSVFSAATDAADVYTWNRRGAAVADSWYLPRDKGGHTGLLYFHDQVVPDPFPLPGTFGNNASLLDWLVFAKVIGSPIYPTRAITGQFDAVGKKTTTLTSGMVTASLRADAPVRKGRMVFKSDPDWTIPETLGLANLERSVILFPAGLDTFAESGGTYAAPGVAIPAVIFGWTGPGGYSGGLQDGQAWDGSVSFAQTRRAGAGQVSS